MEMKERLGLGDGINYSALQMQEKYGPNGVQVPAEVLQMMDADSLARLVADGKVTKDELSDDLRAKMAMGVPEVKKPKDRHKIYAKRVKKNKMARKSRSKNQK